MPQPPVMSYEMTKQNMVAIQSVLATYLILFLNSSPFQKQTCTTDLALSPNNKPTKLSSIGAPHMLSGTAPIYEKDLCFST